MVVKRELPNSDRDIRVGYQEVNHSDPVYRIHVDVRHRAMEENATIFSYDDVCSGRQPPSEFLVVL